MSEPPPQTPPESPPKNSLGTAGFVVSLVGIVTCGLLSPIGFVLSLIGLAKEPKGLAIAGSIIGGIGSLLFFITGLGVLAGLVVVLIPVGQVTETEATVEMAVRAIESHADETGELPSVDEGRELIAEFEDAWGNALRYEPGRDSFTVRSAGSDGAFDTADDVVSSTESWQAR
jgi:hypothetical protein